ncbi:MAG: 2-phosphosulfolactate phosphatase, partial [Bacillota bacterium]
MSPCRLHVLGRKEELDPERIRRSVVVVLDVLFATSTITTLLAHGARAVIPALGESEALQLAERHPDAILAGEREADPIPSFEAPTPLELLKCGVAGREIIYATTNGTVAARRAAGARAVYAGCLLNGPAVARRLLEHHRAETVLLVCAGSAGRFNLEDFYGAGYLVSLLWEGPWCPTDAAVAAAGLFHNPALTP